MGEGLVTDRLRLLGLACVASLIGGIYLINLIAR